MSFKNIESAGSQIAARNLNYLPIPTLPPEMIKTFRWSRRLCVGAMIVCLIIPLPAMLLPVVAMYPVIWTVLVGFPLFVTWHSIRVVRKSIVFALTRRQLLSTITITALSIFTLLIGLWLTVSVIPSLKKGVVIASVETDRLMISTHVIKIAQGGGNVVDDQGVPYPQSLSILLHNKVIGLDDLRAIRGNSEAYSYLFKTSKSNMDDVGTVDELSDFIFYGRSIPNRYSSSGDLLVVISKDLLPDHARILGFADGEVQWVNNLDLTAALQKANSFRNHLGLDSIKP